MALGFLHLTCSNRAGEPKTADLAGTYRLLEWQGQTVNVDRALDIQQDGSIWAYGGCNAGSMRIDPALDHWQPTGYLRATERFCPLMNKTLCLNACSFLCLWAHMIGPCLIAF